MPGAVFLSDGDVALRVPENEDREFLAQNQNDPRIRASRTPSSPSGKVGAERYIGGTLGRKNKTVALLVCIGSDPVGLCLLIREKMGDERYRRGELAFWIEPDEQGNGYATAAGQLLIKYAFDTIGLHKIVARVFEENYASQRVIDKLGFSQEGTFRNEVYVDGNWQDYYRYGLLESDWEAA
jgi:RimJ/RimL family protein N-acetyltransferase